jgi:response regulator RpfG family c-di-GMP phosphodiesterase
MVNALDDGLHQYQLVMAERELLEQTLKGTIKVLTDVLSLVNPEAFGRASRITRYVREIAGKLGKTLPADMWMLETAAMLSQVGWILMPQESIQKLYQGEPFTAEEHQVFQMHPGIARDLLARIPRLEPVAEVVYYQEKGFDGSGIPLDTCRGDAIPLGGRILKAVSDFDISVTRGETPAKAFIRMREKTGLYDPLVLEALEKVLGNEARFDLKTLAAPLLKEKMILAEDLYSLDSTKKILSKGHEMTATILEHLRNYQSLFGLREPIRVFVPLPERS